MLRRVTKDEYHQSEQIKPDPVSYCLECWKLFMGGTGADSLRAKIMNGLVGNEDGYGRDANEAQLAQDTKVGAVTDAAIESLSKRQKWAVYKVNGIGQVWQYNFADLTTEYDAARGALQKILSRKSDTSYLF